MTLSRKFNLKAKAKRRDETETETFGGRSLSRYFNPVAFSKRHGRNLEIEILQVHGAVPAPVRNHLARRPMMGI